MYVRLAFAVAINVDPELLLIDEILAVGDVTFQQRCMEKFVEFREQGRTVVLVTRAMINAAKADGHVDEQEQENILQRVGDVDQEEAEFLRREIAAPLDVQAFIRSVPRGMEQEVYTISLMGIQLDEQSEARYLIDLAQGLGLSADTCNNIHRELGAPEIFK
jgi:uncharacterized membrane protein YebE (DUF533 family)